MITVLLWAITRRVVVIRCGRFGATYRSHHQGPGILYKCVMRDLNRSHLQMGPIRFPETSARNYNYSYRNSPQEHKSHLLRVGNLKISMNAVDCVRFSRTRKFVSVRICIFEPVVQGSTWTFIAELEREKRTSERYPLREVPALAAVCLS
jgi:hypothetical protein